MPRGPGRPAFEPTPEQRKQVEMMAGFGIPADDICRVIINPQTGLPINRSTLDIHFRNELKDGVVKANTQVVGALFKNALAGNVVAQIFWLKCRLRWKPDDDDRIHDLKIVVEGGLPKIEGKIRKGKDGDDDDSDG